MTIKPVILCGGSGTRLWPLSTPEFPKQFQSLTAGESMIELTAKRVLEPSKGGSQIGSILVVGSKKHESLLRKQLPIASLILEPFGRNSAPAVAAACVASNPADLLLILPADHHIAEPKKFLEAIALAEEDAMQGAIVTFGVEPTFPATGYGYIRSATATGAIRPVAEFVEKPEIERAKEYFASGAHYWNAGIFLFRADVMLSAFEAYAPSILTAVRASISDPSLAKIDLDPENFIRADNISIDYAILEHAPNIKVVPVDMGWSDVGGYDALWDMFAETPDDNVQFGPVTIEKSTRLFVRSEGPLISASGLDNVIIVAKPDVVLISSRSDPDAIKRLGKTAQTDSDAHSISKSTSDAANALLNGALEFWEQRCWDAEKGGFVESLDMAGNPQPDVDRRVRVQARQVYTYSEAIRLGYENKEAATRLVIDGLEYLNTVCRHREKGWVHRIAADGTVIDDKRDLYDHAFIMLAGAAAYHALNRADALELAEEALALIDSELSDPRFGGFFEALPRSEKGLRRANPHMHLLEAFLTLFAATSDDRFLERATGIVELFEHKFFDPTLDILIEHFNADWSPAAGDKGRCFEPGHHYEWASLLCFHSRITGRETLSWQRRLIAKADAMGCDPKTGVSYNLVRGDGEIMDDNRRIWHQLEKFRARLLHPGTAHPGEADSFFAMLKKTYFEPMTPGTWIDEISSDGEIRSQAVPASILYHLVTALKPAIKFGR